MASILEPGGSSVIAGRSPSVARRSPLIATAIAVLVILGLYADTAASIVAIWNRSETFVHGYAVVPICLWLAWRARDELAATPSCPWWPALIAVGLAGALWWVMSIAEVIGVRQFALAFMLQGAIVAVLGLPMARVLAFPLLFLLFAVPAGEFLVPTMIDRTADFTVAALRASGVPVYREANHFIIPSGAWSVVEACSGLRYLIASVMIGVVYAAISYRSILRRVAFIAASVAVPVVANWLRAYLIVMTGHLSDNTVAVGVDHLIYGWLFFGIVMALLFWVGSFWAESEPPPASSAASSGRTTGGTAVPASRYFAMALAAIVVAGLWRPLAATTERPGVAPRADFAIAPIAPAGGFARSDPLLPSWRPSYAGYDANALQSFSKDGHGANVYIAYYRDQRKGHELVTSGNQLVLPKEVLWKELARDEVPIAGASGPLEALRAVIVGSGLRLVAYRVFWVDGRLTGSEYAAKAYLAWSRLTGEAGDAALIVVYALEDERRDAAREATEALLPSAVQALETVRGTRR